MEDQPARRRLHHRQRCGRRKLSITAGDNGFNLELGDTGSIFTIEGEGTAKTVSTTVGDKTVYIGMGAKGAFVAGETPYNKISLGLGVMSNWTVSTTLISSVLDEANAVTNDDAYMDESWKAFTAARDEARRRSIAAWKPTTPKRPQSSKRIC